MIDLFCFAQWHVPSSEELGRSLGELVLKVLAVLGSALLGGLGCGLGTQGLAKALYNGKVPPPVLHILRVAGGLVAGVIVALILFSGTGDSGMPGPGGPGIPGPGGPGAGGPEPGATPTTPGSSDQGTPKGPPPQATDGLAVEVLMLPGGGGVADPIYRIKGEDKTFSLKELGEEIDRRRKDNKELAKLEILLYLNSPAADKQQVKELERLAGLKGLTASITKMRGNAP
jgi:hypothetical protein